MAAANKPDGKNKNRKINGEGCGQEETARLVYESSLESARHSDILMWQVTAIIWGANILLLGFVSEALEKQKSRPPITIGLSALGVVLTLFVAHFFRIAKIGQGIAYETCRRIEKDFPVDLRLCTNIHDVYDPAVWPKAKRCVWFITILFLLLWIGILLFAHSANSANVCF